MLVLCYLVLLFIMEVGCLEPKRICQNTTRVCSSPSTPCECKEYYTMATLCYRVDTPTNMFIVEIFSEEQIDFLVRVYQQSTPRPPVLRFETKPASCRLYNLPEGHYKIKIDPIAKQNQVKCFCGGQMEHWCDACNVSVTLISYTGTTTAMPRPPVPPSTTTLTTVAALTYGPKSVAKSTFSDIGSTSDNGSHPTDIPSTDRPVYTQVVIAVATCVILVISLIVCIKQCKGRFRRCIHSKASHHTPSATEEIITHPESPLTEKSIILSTKLADNDPHQDVFDSGFESTSTRQCSILYNVYNGDDVDSLYDEKWGAFSIPKPVTYELGHNDKSRHSQCNGCNLKKTNHASVQIQQPPPSAPSDVHFSPPEDQSLALSEEMFRINSSYMNSIIAERNQQIPSINERSDGIATTCQVCRTTLHSKELCQKQGPSPTTFDILSLGGKSV